MQIQLSDHFDYKRLLKFTAPSIAMMVFTSIYGVIDGFFVSNFTSKTAFAAVNLIFPYIMILGAFGFMLGTGGTALVAKILGEGDKRRANGIFSMIVFVSVFLGILISALGIIFIRPIAVLLGAEGELLDSAVKYGRIILVALPAFMLQQEFQSFFIVAEKPKLGFISTVIAGVTNIILDALLVMVLELGIVGAAVATALSQLIGGLIPLIYFLCERSGIIRLTRPEFDIPALVKASLNGSSEFMTNISMSVVCMLYNFRLMQHLGENGIAAYGVMMYVGFVFVAVFIGFTIGASPVISFNYGAENKRELKSLSRKCISVIAVFSVLMLIMSVCLTKPFSHIFVGYDKELLEITETGFFIYSFSFLFTGIAIYSSGFFTALNNGVISALLSTLRILVFQVAAILVLPIFFGTMGIWYSLVVSEIFAAITSILFIASFRKNYGY